MILVTGATGNTGRELVGLLHTAGVPFRALSRDPARAGLPTGVEVMAGDLTDPPTLGPALAGVDQVFVCATAPIPAKVANLLDAARGTALRHVVFLSSLATESPSAADSIAESHRGGEALIRDSGIPFTFLRPGTFMANFLYWAETIRADGSVQSIWGNDPAAPIDPLDIATIAFLALTTAGHDGQAYRLTGPEAFTPEQAATTIGKIIGRSISFAELPWDVAVSVIAHSLEDADDPDATLRGIRGPALPWTEPDPTFARLAGRPARTIREWAIAHADVFR